MFLLTPRFNTFGLNPVEPCQIAIQHYLNITNSINVALNGVILHNFGFSH